MIEIIVNSRSKKSLIELDKIEQVLQEKKLPYKVLKTSKNKNANSLMNEDSFNLRWCTFDKIVY